MLKIQTRKHGDLEIPTEQQVSVAEQILTGKYVAPDGTPVAKGYTFYEVASFDAPTISAPVKPGEMRADKDYLAIRQFAGG